MIIDLPHTFIAVVLFRQKKTLDWLQLGSKKSAKLYFVILISVLQNYHDRCYAFTDLKITNSRSVFEACYSTDIVSKTMLVNDCISSIS